MNDARVHRLWLGAVILLAGCNPDASTDAPSPSNHPLETAARDRGLVNAGYSAPTGTFERRHEIGRDAMCIAPARDGDYRFVVEASFGAGLYCQVRGVLRAGAGNKGWTLEPDDAPDCRIPVAEADDELSFPGVMPDDCVDLCPGSASLAGLSIPRTGWDARGARALRFRAGDGVRVSGGPGASCAE